MLVFILQTKWYKTLVIYQKHSFHRTKTKSQENVVHRGHFIKKETLTQVFPYKFCKIIKTIRALYRILKQRPTLTKNDTFYFIIPYPHLFVKNLQQNSFFKYAVREDRVQIPDSLLIEHFVKRFRIT